MQRFPSLVFDHQTWRLPLSPATACRLADILVFTESESRQSSLLPLMSEDASLTLWAVCRAAQRNSPEIQTLKQASLWLEENALHELHWTQEERTAQSQTPDRELQDRLKELAFNSVASASTAAQLGKVDLANISDDKHYFLGLLHNACEWLSLSGPTASASSPRKSDLVLPHGLAEEICHIEKQAANGPAAVVVESLAALSAAAKGPTGKKKTSPSQLVSKKTLALATSAAARWKTKSCHDDHFLPLLVERLASLGKFQEQFEQQLEQEKMAAMKELAYGASHEINNPLANIANRAQLLLRGETDPERRRMLASINTQAFRATEMISDLMLFANPPRIELGEVDLSEMVQQVLDRLTDKAQHQGTKLVFTPPQPILHAIGDEVHLSEALRALCLNSLEALDAGGCVEVIVQRSSAPVDVGQNGEIGSWIEIVIRDNGPGIPDEIRRRLFDPYFSGREAGRGLGLGLSKCWRIVTEHHGSIIVESSSSGTSFTIALPEATLSKSTMSKATLPKAASSPSKTPIE